VLQHELSSARRVAVAALAALLATACSGASRPARNAQTGRPKPDDGIRLAVQRPLRDAALRIRWRHSLSLGRPDRGTLVHGVRFPAEGTRFFTWDPILHRSPDRPWRRYGNDRLVRIVLHVLAGYARAHPQARRVGIGDFSRPHGGYFGPKHASHQNGLDVDVYYPRLDGRERPPIRAAQIDRPLAQDLLKRFLAAGAVRIFVGPNTHLTGPARIVQVLALHDNHMHVRIAAP
jgi:murein endopeptidase